MFKGSGEWEKALAIFTKKGYTLKVEPLQERYKIELQRDRKDRVKAIEEYLGQAKGLTDIDGL